MANPCVQAGVSFDDPTISATICTFSLSLVLPKFFLTIPSIPFPPPFFPFPYFKLVLSCDLNKPIDVSAGVKFGGGRIPCFDPDPDQDFDS